jgi:hypothetical protein
MIFQDLFHQVHSRKMIASDRLPANTIQVRAETEADCFLNRCQPLAY